jgi:TatD DNase family protein
MSLTCAVEPGDWEECLKYAATSSWHMAAIGVHPWYLANLPDTWLSDLEALLQQHRGCMVGEIGLCKMARFLRTYEKGKQAALELQRRVFVQQLCLAAKYQRPVTIHCVNQQGVLLDILKENQDSLPPAIGLHSFTGTSHHVKKLLEWEQSLKLSEPLLYFGFSHTVNYAMCTSDKSRRQGKEAIRQVPADRLLAESDVHHDADVAAGTAGAVAYLAWAREESIDAVSELTRRNGLQFLRRLHVS